MAGPRLVEAAGAIVLRRAKGRQPQVLLIHRPSYHDWSLPKGKLDPDEYLAAAAVRETREETEVRIRLMHPVDRIQYPIPTGTKRVAYWLGAEIEQKGLEAVIARLEAENQKAEAPKGAGASKA